MACTRATWMAGHASHQGNVRSLPSSGSGPGDTLPSGSCDFRDLSLGSGASVCGCKRFWLNLGNINGQDGGTQRAWCFCGHHACFHNAFSPEQTPQELAQAMTSSRVVAVDHYEAPTPLHETVTTQSLRSSPPPKPPAGLGIRPDSKPQPQSINTRVWQALNDFARNQEDGYASETHSKLLSTAASSVVDETRLSPNRIMQDRLQLYRPMGPPVTIPQETGAPRPIDEYSATEVATPSIAGTPDFKALASSNSQAHSSPGHLRPARIRNHTGESERHCAVPHPAGQSEREIEVTPATNNPLMSARDVQTMLTSLATRLDNIENMSFSQVQIEELQERSELFDGRLIDMEQWRLDHEQAQSSPEPSRRHADERRHLPSEKGSFESQGSLDLSAAAQTEAVVLATLAAHAETNPRIEDLDRRVGDLESRAMPSFAHPWQIQVVLLPWGRDLRGVWFSSQDSTQPSLKSTTRTSEEWTFDQSPAPLSYSTSFGDAWTTESIQAWAKEADEWLSPKGCGPNGAVFQRLRSRGFIRDVEILASDSRHILATITQAFSSVLKVDPCLDAETRKCQGLSEKVIPLRKVRKSSRLRFLSLAEMITSSTWTASFLDSSIFMKVTDNGRRLYITTPNAYAQPAGTGWSWDTIRQLPIFDYAGQEKVVQAQNLASEACWTYNHALDHQPNTHSSFASHESQWSTRSQHSKAARNNPELQKQPISPRSESLLLHRRTLSLNSNLLTGEPVRELPPKRRVCFL